MANVKEEKKEKKYRILVSRYNNPPVNIYVKNDEDKNFVYNLLCDALADRKKYPNIVSISTIDIDI